MDKKKVIRTPYPKKEIWKTAIYHTKGHDIYFSRYKVSNFGKIKVVDPFNSSSSYNQKILSQTGYDGSYRRANLYLKPKKYMKVLVHRLVARTFIGKPKDREEVNHKNMNKSLNWVTNLEWVTHSKNELHKWQHIAIDTSNFKRGEGHSQVKLSKIKVNLIKTLSRKKYDRKLNPSYIIKAKLAKKFNVSIHTINAVWWRKSWRHLDV